MRAIITKFTTLSLLAISLLSPAYAGDAEPVLPAPIQALVDDGAQIRYLGNDLGMNGWVTMKAGQEQYFYATPDGQAILSGILFNAKGDAITLQQINALRKNEGEPLDRLAGYVPTTDKKEVAAAVTDTSANPLPDFKDPATLLKTAVKSKGEQLYEGAVSANWVALGNKEAPTIYTFIDPECPHCHDLIQDIRKSGFLENGSLQLRLIPVGVLSEASLKEAAYLLASPTPQQDLYSHLDGNSKALMVDSNANTQGVERNMKLMQDWNLEVTPFSVYKAKNGKVKILQGRPDNLKKIITELR